MFVPFVLGNLNHRHFRDLHARAPQDAREWLILPSETYPFWQFGYWLGLNKLAKIQELTYKQGDLALLVFDNVLARKEWPITDQDRGTFAHWAATKLPPASLSKLRWKAELHSVPQTKPCHMTHAKKDFLYLSAKAAKWVASYTPIDNKKNRESLAPHPQTPTVVM